MSSSFNIKKMIGYCYCTKVFNFYSQITLAQNKKDIDVFVSQYLSTFVQNAARIYPRLHTSYR